VQQAGQNQPEHSAKADVKMKDILVNQVNILISVHSRRSRLALSGWYRRWLYILAAPVRSTVAAMLPRTIHQAALAATPQFPDSW
jgi:hypothetical protein